MAEPMSAERFLDRWQNYRDQPQQVSGIRALHAAIAALEGGAQILDEQATWARQFSQKPAPAPTHKPQPKKSGAVALTLPFFDQTNDGPDGWRHCQSSSVAMNLAYLGVPGIKDDLDYLKVVQRHGDTTQQAAHAAALGELKAPGRFISSCSVERAKAELDKGFGLAFGILHHGPVTAPSGGGHYIAIRGYDASGWLVHDPYGELDLVRGVWARQGQGAGRKQHYSFANTNPRWLLEGAQLRLGLDFQQLTPMVVLIATVAIGLYLLLSVLLGGWPGSRFNRERFLLGCLAGIFLAQFILYGVGVGLCAHLLDQRYAQLRSKGCPEILNRLNDAFESAINATLALLGGAGAVSLGLRRREEQGEQEGGAGSGRGTGSGPGPGAGSGPGPDGP